VERSTSSQLGTHRQQDSPGAVVAVFVTVLWVLAGCVLAGCHSATGATGQVDSVAAGRICFTPENSDRTDLIGCWPINADDAVGLQQGDCITAQIPHEATDRVTAVRKLDRACHVGVEPSVSTNVAIENALLFAAVPAAVVIFGVVLPRRRRRRAAALEADRLIDRSSDFEPTEVEVIEFSEPEDRSDHHR
jgi:hypothetical protein